MTLTLASLLPRRISAQIATIIIVSLIAIHTIMSASFLLERRDQGRPPHGSLGQLGSLLKVIDSAEPALRLRLVPEIAKINPAFEIALPVFKPVESGADPDERADDLMRYLGPEVRIAALRAVADTDAQGRVAVHLRDGQVVTARLPADTKPGINPVPASALSLAIIMTLLGLWATRALTAPLRAFAAAAEAFSPDAAIAPLPEAGPDEIRTAARALNRMRERIKRLVDDRLRMLAAVSHDLRTPITRLRLCSEFVDDDALRGQMLETLEQMNTMVDSVLNFLREGRSQEEVRMIDVAITLRTICDQFTDVGRDVIYHGPDHVTIRARPGALRRAVTNLIDNAVRYGVRALVRLSAEAKAVIISVEDEGPGIPDERKEAMLEPFVRGDAARGMDGQSGFGLGLAIAHEVVAAHGGTLAMLDRKPTGLITRIKLPV
jgi:signal transduction histidine kinase